MVQTEITDRVFRLKFANSKATTFTLEQNNIQFLVTARHVFKSNNYPNSATVELLINGTYKSFTVEIKYPTDPQIDIAVMKTNPYQTLTPFFNNEFVSNGLIYGQDVYFLGYPFDYDSFLATFPNNNSPLPFVKKACFSGMLGPKASMLFLDGHNNPGFSGGPVCFKKEGARVFSIAGVISGYRPAKSYLYDKNDNLTDFYIQENSGIIHVADISFAIEIAKNWNSL